MMLNLSKTISLSIILLITSPIWAQQNREINKIYLQQKKMPNQPVFQVNNPDHQLSPYTGMTREHWKEAALYLLKGAFSYVDKIDDPMQFPKLPGKSYPTSETQVPTEKLEGLCRTLFIAAPLLKEDSNLVINHIRVADYYRYQIRKLIDPGSATFIKHRSSDGGPAQNLVEFGGLSVSLFAIPEILWNPLTRKEKDALAATMLSYGDGPTLGNNWKYFNIFILSFFKDKGYTVNEKLLVEYLDKVLQHYEGNGWYHDNTAYDYYSMWAFEMYGPLWAEFFGKKHYPQIAQQLLSNFSAVKDNYPYMFSRNGEMIMWGRSISYRMGCTIPLALTGMVKDHGTNYGWMRRISSGALKQFLTNPNFLQDNIPTLGFYGAFDPAVQSYSCRGSVFWMGKAFLALFVPKDSPYWTAKENNGPWEEEFKKGQVYNKFEPGSNILITDYPNIGASEIRAWSYKSTVNGGMETENYNRLSYNSAFPWQADGAGIVSMSYIIKKGNGPWKPFQAFSFQKYKDGVYYRNAGIKGDSSVRFNLSEMPLPNGILRVDLNRSAESFQLHLGHYALPRLNDAIKETQKKIRGYNVRIIDNGQYQLAMVTLSGWKTMAVFNAKGLNPVSNESAVINAENEFVPNSKPALYVTLMLWKKTDEQWSDDELVPIKKIEQLTDQKVAIRFLNGNKRTIDFN